MASKCYLSLIPKILLPSQYSQVRYVHYIQGQEPEPKIREYFYFIDHQGMVSNLCTSIYQDMIKNPQYFRYILK